MGSPRQRSVAVGLAVGLLLVTGLMSTRMAMHALHHAHHKASTHSTVVCAWMCAAGQVMETGAVQLPQQAGCQVFADDTAPAGPDDALPRFSASRGPPSHHS